MSTDITSQIASEVAELDAVKQLQVLAYLRALKQPTRGLSGAELKSHAGTISEEDAKLMIEAIDAGCEQVDRNGW